MLTLVNPATEEPIAQLETASREDVARAYTQAAAAQMSWAALPYIRRAEFITRFRGRLATELDSCADLMSREMGKPIHQACSELRATLQRIDWFLEYTPAALAGETVRVAPPFVEEISYEPLGVVGNISAWNFPYFVGTNVIIPALLTGNTVLYKASELTALTGLKIAELFHEAGLPAGVFTALTGAGEVGECLLEQPLDALAFTGSQATGRLIAARVATGFPRTTLELGGKDAAYVCEDAAVQTAAETLADGSFYNAGQSCCAVERIYVHANVYDEFCEHFARFTRSLTMGNPKDPGTYMGPLARQSQLAFLSSQVDDALAQGARYLLAGGPQSGSGYYFAPTALTEVHHGMKIMREESFGPVIGIQRVQDDAEAVMLMNDSDYGLTASVHTQSEERARRLMHPLKTGTVYWNCCDRVSPYLPWSGRGGSGLGTSLSHLGIKTFLQAKAWHWKHGVSQS